MEVKEIDDNFYMYKRELSRIIYSFLYISGRQLATNATLTSHQSDASTATRGPGGKTNVSS